MSSNKTDVINYDEETQAEEYGTGELEKIKGVVANQKTNIEITENDSDWLAGKVKGDKKAADRFAEKFWSEEQTEKLKNQINNSENTLFVSVPSSSKNNVHPVSLAEKLSEAFGGKFAAGETYQFHEQSSEKCRCFCKSTETCKTSDIYRGKNYHRTYKQSRFGR
jgi:hypothetical protein